MMFVFVQLTLFYTTVISKGDVEKAFDYFRLLQQSYLPVDGEVYALLRGKIQEAFATLLANTDVSKPPSIETLSIYNGAIENEKGQKKRC